MENRKKTLLVDGNSLLRTTFEASFSSLKKGKSDQEILDLINDISGIYGFLLKLRITLDQGNYNNLRIAFDSKNSGSLRRNVYPDYKISRSKDKDDIQQMKQSSFEAQKAKLQSYLSHFCHWYEDDVVEADDVIYLYIKNKKPNEIVHIMTGDVDIMQLIDKDVFVWYLNKSFKTKTKAVKKYEKTYYNSRKHLLFDRKKFIKFFSFPPENIILIKTICGDESDDIKNIKRVKEQSLFNAYPEIKEKPLDLAYVLSKADDILKTSKDKKIIKTVRNIVNRVTDGIQGKKILEINQRLVDLSNEEFITEECISNLQNSGFLSDFKYKAKDSQGLVKKIAEDGVYKHIQENFGKYNKISKPFTKFFKPFKKTIL